MILFFLDYGLLFNIDKDYLKYSKYVYRDDIFYRK